MDNIDKLLQWELHPSRVFYACRDAAGTRPRFVFTPDKSPIPEGATGWFVGEQNAYGFPLFMTGVRNGDERQKAFGKAVMLAGIRPQKREGWFPCGEDIHHSMAFFLEVAARLVLLRERTNPGDLLEFYKSLRYGGQWFGAPAAWQDGWWQGRMCHRYFLNSSTLYLADAALRSLPDTPELQWLCGPLPDWCLATADAWVDEGLRRQRDDGAITEGCGHDTGYHSLSITFMTGTLMAAHLEAGRRNALEICLRKAVRWLLSRVDSDGVIDASGNTRMKPDYGGAGGRFGHGSDKGIKFYETAFALQGAGLYLEDAACLQAVEKIMARGMGA